MSIYEILEVIKEHSFSTTILILLIVSKLVSVSKIPLDPWKFIGSCVSRIFDIHTHELNEKLNEMSMKLDGIAIEYKDNQKKNLRRSILRFADECRIGRRHSKEMFDTVLCEIAEYEKICSETGDPNHVIAEAVKVIKELYHRCYSENDFL